MQKALNAVVSEIQGAVRFRWHALIAAWALCLLGWAVVMALPDVYESSTRVFADTRTALSPVIQGLAIQQDVAAQLNLVEQSLLGDTQIFALMNQTDLATKAKTEGQRVKIMRRLRDDIDISVEPIDPAHPGGSIFTLTYRDEDRDRSLKVAQILLKALVENTQVGKQLNSATAQKFLANQIRENELRLREAEQQLAAFKKENVGTMPGVEGDYFTRLQNEIDANRKAQATLSVALARRDELNRQLREGASAAAAAGSGASVRPIAADGRPVSSRDTAGRLAEAQQKLSDLLNQYTDKHPVVAALREEISELEQRRARELEALRQGDPAAVAATGASANPVYQSIQLALNEVGVEIASLRGEINQHEQKIGELRRLVQTVPEVEAEFARLNRDYDVNKTQYLALLERMQKAKLGQDAEATGSGVRLEVLDPPTASFRPVAPQRPTLVVVVFVLAMLAAGALAYVLSKLNPVFDHAHDLEAKTALPVLGVVSLTWFDTYQEASRRSYRRLAAAAAGLFLAFVIVLLISRGISNPLA